MTPIGEREFGELAARQEADHERIEANDEKFEKLVSRLDSYLEKHGDVHASISGQFGRIYILSAIILLALGAAIARVFGG